MNEKTEDEVTEETERRALGEYRAKLAALLGGDADEGERLKAKLR
ncbi:hypothetical protein [Nannocystis sp. SCPEA4]|nr:hypothetical protein [Nannocystis sp. SCPEA4]MCY1062160.1 hypothetical protein [Nannocystis sp. SCPEA4]